MNAQYNNTQNSAAYARAGGNVRTDMYANQALQQNYTNAARDLNMGYGASAYGGAFGGGAYNGAYNATGMGSLGLNFNIGLGGSAGYGW